jgi:riboflavin kinase/FMN adenylyltransferase
MGILIVGKPIARPCSVGNRPIIGGKKTLLEVFLFDFNQQVYGLEAKIIFKQKISDRERMPQHL